MACQSNLPVTAVSRKGERKPPLSCAERSRDHQRQQSILLHAFAVNEEEQLVLDDRSADAAAEVVALVVADLAARE